MNRFFPLFVSFISVIFSAQEYAVSEIPSDLKKNASIVVRKDYTNIVINAIDDMEATCQKVYTVLDKSAEDEAAIYIPYDKTRKVSDIKVQILDENGKVIKKLYKSDFTDVSAVSAGAIYVDDRILYLQYLPTSYPYTISYSYTEKTPNTVFISDYYPFYSYNVSLQDSKLSILNKSNINLRTKVTNSEWASLSKSGNNNDITYSFQNVKAIEKEKYSPSLLSYLPRVEFSLEKFNLEGKQGDLSTWNSFGAWVYNNLLVPVSTVTPEIKTEVLALNLSGTTSEKVKKIYQYMQNKTRYVNVSIGIGGWKPSSPDEVRKKGYGDCKGLTNYMKTLLDAAGIKSNYCIINSNQTPISFANDFPKMSGNHIILVVPTENGNIWLENTSQSIAFNHLSYKTTDRNVLAIKENGLDIINTPVYKAEENLELVNAKAKINEQDGSIDVMANFKYTNAQYDFNRAYIDLNNDDFKKEILENYGNLQIENLQTSTPVNNKDAAELTYDLSFKAKNYTKKLGNDFLFKILPLTESSSFGTVDERKMPLSIPFAFQDKYDVEFTLPAGYKITEMPSPVNLKSEFGEYSLNFNVENNKLMVHRTLTNLKGSFPKEKFKEFAEFIKKISYHDHTKILITK